MIQSHFSSLLAVAGQVETEQAVKSANGPFDQLVWQIENSYLFQRYISTWSPPLNNPSFDAVLLIIIAFILVGTIYGIVTNIIYHKKAKVKQAKIRAERERYMKFLAENGATGNAVMSFDEWRTIKDSEGKQLTPEQKAVIDNYEAVKDEIKDTAIDKLTSLTETLKARKEDRDLDRELDAREKEEAARQKAIAEEEQRLSQLKKETLEAPKKEESVKEALIPKPVKTTADDIRQKYTKELAASELVDIDDDEKVVSVSESSIVKEVVVPDRPVVNKEELKPVDVAQLLEEKTTEARKQVTLSDAGGFDSLIGNLRAKREQEEKAREIETAAQEATQQNLEKLKNDMEFAISEDRGAKQKAASVQKADTALTEAQKRALREREKERIKLKKRGK